MKSRTLTCVTAMTLFAALALPVRLAAQEQQGQHKKEQPRYSVKDLGTLGGTFSLAGGINNRGEVEGFSTLPGDTVTRAFLWRKGLMIDLGTLGGPNSFAVFRPNERAEVGGYAETSTPDPLGEDFCGFGTNLICLPFLWKKGVMTPLPTLGGNNGIANQINNRGQLAGQAENMMQDPTCVAPQILQFKPVIWRNGEVQELPTFPGDPDGIAFAINDNGKAIGSSGNCGTPVLRHALLWHRRDEAESQNEDDWTVTDLGSLGGTMFNAPQDINNRGQVVGFSNLPGDTTTHAFLWQNGVMTDLGTLPGDFSSFAYGINGKGHLVGTSVDASGNPRAFLWQSGVMTDLNTLIAAGSSLFLFDAFSVNSRGEIVGDALQTSTGEVHAFLATPREGEDDDCATPATSGATSESPKVSLPENVRKMLRERLTLGRFGARGMKRQ